MQNQEENDEGKIIDFKGTIEAFVEGEMPEISQQEAIKEYKDRDIIQNYKKKNKKVEDEEENEDDEHLKRVKRELLASLERVNELEKQIFEEKVNLKNIKLKNNSGNAGGKGQSIGKEIVQSQEQNQTEKGEERSRE